MNFRPLVGRAETAQCLQGCGRLRSGGGVAIGPGCELSRTNGVKGK